MARTRSPAMHHGWVLVAILLVGVFLRCMALAPMEDMLSYDEAYNGVDALSLLRSPRLTPFLPANQGRESGWVYLLAPFVAVFGARPFGLRLAAAMTGVLTLAACYALGREVLGRRGATWAMAALAVLYWHVHTSHLALRVNLLLLIGALAFAALLRAGRTNARAHWLAAGLGIGCLAYTYFSAYLWILYALSLLACWFISRREQRRGILLACCIALIVFLPMAAYTARHPAQVLQRASAVQVLSPQGVWGNLRLWARAWFLPGGPNPRSDPLGRPILDGGLGALFLLGLGGLPWLARRRWQALWVAGLGLAALLPSLLSDHAPHSLRGVGLVLPIALVAGAGARALEHGLGATALRRLGALAPLALLAVAGGISYRDSHLCWLSDAGTFTVMEVHVGQAIRLVKAHTPADMPVYFSPFSLDHPVLAFRAPDLAPRAVRAFDSHQCQAIADRPAAYVSLTLFEPGFKQSLAPWADLAVLVQEQSTTGDPPRYTIFQATPRAGDLGARGQAAILGDAVQLWALSPIPATVRPGEAVTIHLGLRALRPLDRVYSVFVHLYGDPTPYEGGRMWSQGDCQLCPSYPTTLWQTDETIVQAFPLAIPEDTPPGRYTVAVGVYQAPEGPRLPVTAPAAQKWDYVALAEVEIGG